MKELTTDQPTQMAIYKPTKRQRKFIEHYFEPSSDSFGNAYQSALAAGYSEKSARIITGNARNLQWVKEAMKVYSTQLEPEHIYLGLQSISLNSRADRDKLRALELMAKIRGMFIERHQSEVHVKFTNSVPRPNNE